MLSSPQELHSFSFVSIATNERKRSLLESYEIRKEEDEGDEEQYKVHMNLWISDNTIVYYCHCVLTIIAKKIATRSDNQI